jgi:hypothetical protein
MSLTTKTNESIVAQGARDATALSESYSKIVVDELEGVDLRKMNLQLVAYEENQDRAQCGKNEASGMISIILWARKHVGNGAADDRSDDAEDDRPEHRHVHVHHRFRDHPRDEPNEDIPD